MRVALIASAAAFLPCWRPGTFSTAPSAEMLPSSWAPSRVERYGSRATVSFESLHIRIPLKFCQNSAKLSQFFRNSENFRTSQHFLECSAKFRKKSSKSVQNSMKIVEKSGFLQKFEQKCEKSLTNFCEYFEFAAVRRCAKSCRFRKMLKNEYLVAKIGFDTEENEPSKV